MEAVVGLDCAQMHDFFLSNVFFGCYGNILLKLRTFFFFIRLLKADIYSTVLYHFSKLPLYFSATLLYTNIDQTLMPSLHGLLNCEIDGLDYHVITTEYTHVTPIL